jgi:hypothetical protein
LGTKEKLECWLRRAKLEEKRKKEKIEKKGVRRLRNGPKIEEMRKINQATSSEEKIRKRNRLRRKIKERKGEERRLRIKEDRRKKKERNRKEK